jgi:hypothetical protein
MTKIFMGIPSTGDRNDAQTYFLRRIEQRYAGKVQLVYPEQFVGRIFHDYARNAYVEQFLQSDCDLIWFLDSDVVPPENVLDLVVNHGDKWKLAGAPYPVWMTVPGFETLQVVFTVYRGDGTGKLHAASIPESGTDFVEGIATGCLFIHREVIQKMSKPYFEFKYNPESREIIEGEDLGFCKKVGTLGYKFFTDFSMVCHHYKKVSLLDVSNTIELQKTMAVNTYDQKIRQIIAKKKLQMPTKSRLILNK